MRIHQYAYFYVKSESVTPGQVTELLLIEPSRVSWRGSMSSHPLRPKTHIWEYRAREQGCIDGLINELVEVFEPLSDRLRTLTANDACSFGINVVRSFDDPDGIEEDSSPPAALPETFVKLSGQHQLLGFHLEVELLGRLASLDCSLDFDEYG